MSNQKPLKKWATVAIKVKTPSGERYFCRLSKGWRIQTAWSLAGAALFLVGGASEVELRKVAHTLKAKSKQFEVVEIAEFVGGAR